MEAFNQQHVALNEGLFLSRINLLHPNLLAI